MLGDTYINFGDVGTFAVIHAMLYCVAIHVHVYLEHTYSTQLHNHIMCIQWNPFFRTLCNEDTSINRTQLVVPNPCVYPCTCVHVHDNHSRHQCTCAIRRCIHPCVLIYIYTTVPMHPNPHAPCSEYHAELGHHDGAYPGRLHRRQIWESFVRPYRTE